MKPWPEGWNWAGRNCPCCCGRGANLESNCENCPGCWSCGGTPSCWGRAWNWGAWGRGAPPPKAVNGAGRPGPPGLGAPTGGRATGRGAPWGAGRGAGRGADWAPWLTGWNPNWSWGVWGAPWGAGRGAGGPAGRRGCSGTGARAGSGMSWPCTLMACPAVLTLMAPAGMGWPAGTANTPGGSRDWGTGAGLGAAGLRGCAG